MFQSHAVGSAPGAVEVVPQPESGTKLKSERVQLDLQLLPGDRGVLRTLAEGGTVTLQSVTLRLGFDAVAASPEAEGGEADPVAGTPGQFDRPSTERKEVGHANPAHAR